MKLHKLHSTVLPVAVALVWFSGVGLLSAAVSYTTTKLSSLPGVSYSGTPYDINNHGQVVGYARALA